MPRILHRYLLRESLYAWLVVTIVLLLILMTNQFASVVGDAAANKLPRTAILEVMGLTTIQYLTILIPVGFFLAVMLALARLYHDSEMAAMMACGSGSCTALSRDSDSGRGFGSGGGPAGSGHIAGGPSPGRSTGTQAKREASLGLLVPGRFVSFADGAAALYAESVAPDGHLHQVFVQRRRGDKVEVIVADEAWQEDAGNGVRILTFAHGRRYEGEPGNPKFRILQFAEHGIPVELPASGPPKVRPEARTLRDLLGSTDSADRAELQWRIGVPLTLLVLAILAVPLARTEPRSGRFSGLASAVLVYLIYANLLAAGRGWLERGQVPEVVGLWWVHALFLLVAAAMLVYQHGSWRAWLGRKRPVMAS
ncbi:MAG: LPS export ABC transporter permease LptF [Gammaproteobacteria bacterium]